MKEARNDDKKNDEC